MNADTTKEQHHEREPLERLQHRAPEWLLLEPVARQAQGHGSGSAEHDTERYPNAPGWHVELIKIIPE